MALKTILILILLAAAVCVPIVVLTHRSLMPNQAELTQLDTLVKEKVPSATVKRLPSPDRIEKVGDTKIGYFSYTIRDSKGEKRARADWRIDKGNVELVSFTVL